MIAAVGCSGWRERVCVALLLLAALIPRARDLWAPFDREFEGAQAAFFAIGAVNYERLGVLRTGGYPVVNIDLGPREDAQRDLRNAPGTWYVYANHPPLVPLLAWLSIRAGAPRDWSQACDANRAPQGIEAWIRLPFLITSMLGLLALWWAVRQAAGPRRALIALAIAAALPICAIYGTLVNYENPALLCILVAVGFYARWVRDSSQRSLLACALAFAAGSAVTYSAMFFVPALALHAWSRVGWRRALRFVAFAASIAVAPILLHALWSAHAQHALGLEAPSLLARVQELLGPLLDGSHPIGEWAGLQVQRLGVWFTWPIVLAAGLGLALCAFDALRRCVGKQSEPGERDEQLDLEPVLLAGGALFLLASYRHTLDPQFTFLILLVPALSGLAAFALDRLAQPLAKMRAGVAPLVLATAMLAAFGLWRTNDLRFDFRSRGTESRADRPAPALPLPDVSGAELATLVPAGGLGIYPAGLGLNLAVSFYAWRSLWPATGANDTLPIAVAQRFGLGSAPRVLLLPKYPWPAVAAKAAELEHSWAKDLPPDRESEHWRAWDLY